MLFGAVNQGDVVKVTQVLDGGVHADICQADVRTINASAQAIIHVVVVTQTCSMTMVACKCLE